MPVTIQVNLCMMTVNAPAYNTTQLVVIDSHLAESNKVNKVRIGGKAAELEDPNDLQQKQSRGGHKKRHWIYPFPSDISTVSLLDAPCFLLCLKKARSRSRDSMMQVFNLPKDSWYLRLETFCGQVFYFRRNDTPNWLYGKRFM